MSADDMATAVLRGTDGLVRLVSLKPLHEERAWWRGQRAQIVGYEAHVRIVDTEDEQDHPINNSIGISITPFQAVRTAIEKLIEVNARADSDKHGS